MNDNEGEDAVGYGHPPREHRFAKGHSGNALGRPKTSKNFLKELRAELASTTIIKEAGCDLSISKQEAVIKRLIAAALSGDARAMGILVPLCQRTSGEERAQEFSEDDRRILEAHIEREVERRLNARSTKQRSETKPTTTNKESD